MKKIRDIFSGNEGFTLIELLIVIVIIGVLAAIAVPNLTGLGDTADEEAVRANARTLAVELEAFKASPGEKTIPTTDFDDDDLSDSDDWTDFSGMVALINQEGVTVTINSWDQDSDKDLNDYKITISGDYGDDIEIQDGSITTSS